MTDTVTITIDDQAFEVPGGMNLIDAAKQCGVDIPVFCYHPKLGHDGNCRMCLVELGTPRKNRDTGEMELAWFPNLVTACTQTVVEGMAVRTTTERVKESRKEILELLLSSHPLDCPICDKGGECPLQNLTMEYGPGTSRMYWEQKMHLGKHIPLGELIYLDQERCIHCARCIRFQELIADDPVLSFDQRGRKQQIVTYSEPGFDSIFSGNTTDICPVGALTTADFRFHARPWEMVQVASLCTQCPVGCNLTFDTRTDREAGGRTTIRRIMPRQNEQVNETWLCDKGRFARQHMEHPERLTSPLIRKGGKLVETTWEEALREIALQVKSAAAQIGVVAGGHLSNEDYYAIQKVVRGQGSNNLSLYPANAVGGELAALVGVGTGTNLSDMGAGDAIMVVASDLHQEAPLWWLRVKAAAERGAQLIVVNGRETRLDKYAAYSIRYTYGEEAAVLAGMLGDGASDLLKAAGQAFAEAENAVIFVGNEGLDALAGENLGHAAANLLLGTGHVGRANNGLIIVWPYANGQGASDMGFRPDYAPGYRPVEQAGLGYEAMLAGMADNSLKLLVIAGADPVFDDPAAEQAFRQTNGYIVVQDLFLTATAELADVVLPVQSAAEREGAYTSGERRVQRTYPAIEPIGESLPDWQIAQLLGEQLGMEKPAAAASLIMAEITQAVPQYAGITYPAMAQVAPQFPDVGGDDLYYGGTAFQNRHGLGVQYPSAAEAESVDLSTYSVEAGQALRAGDDDSLVVVPVTVIYDAEPVFARSELLHQRVPRPYLALNPADAVRFSLEDGDPLTITVGDWAITAAARLDERVPTGAALMPRRLQAQATFLAPVVARIGKLEIVGA